MQDVLVVVHDNEAARAGYMRWGLVPAWANDPTSGARMINARSETIDEKSAFREAFERRRCLVVADGYYEWRRLGDTKVPMRIRLKGNRLFAFAGLWEKWSRAGVSPLLTCTILTTSPSPSINHIHDRMPVILSPEDRARWLNRSADPDELKGMLVSYPDDELEAYPVSPHVNYVENDDPTCVAAVEPPIATEQTSLF